MSQIGFVTKQDNGTYTGYIRTLSVKAKIDILPNSSKKEGSNQPDFRIYAENVEIGAAWTRHSERSGKDYISLTLAAPEFGPRKLRANLGQAAGLDDDDVYAIIWDAED